MIGRIARTYCRLWSLSFFRRSEIPRTQRRPWSFLIAFFSLFPLIECFNTLCLALDHIFFPGHRRANVAAPVFIIGNPRSGTTILHRVLARDPQFYFFRSWEIFFPSLLQKRVLRFLGRCDGWLGSPFVKLLAMLERRRFQKINRLHEISLFLPEEDDKLFLHILASADNAFMFPYAGFDRYAHFDTDIPRNDQDAAMQFYTACVRRQAWLHRPTPHLLCKNPAFTGKIENLRRHFPDARLVYLVRSPLEVVPSMISLGRNLVQGSFGITPGPDLDETAYGIIKRYYLEAPEKLAAWPHNQCITVDYRDLVKRPKETIQNIYDQLGLTLSPEFAAILEEESAKMLAHKSGHKYSADTTAIAPERIVRELQIIFVRHGFAVPDTLQSSTAAMTQLAEAAAESA